MKWFFNKCHQSKKPEINIHTFASQYLQYIEAIRENEDDKMKQYEQMVVAPIWEILEREGHYPNLAWPYLMHSAPDTDDLEEKISILEAAETVQLVEKTLKKCMEALRCDGVTVYLVPSVSETLETTHRLGGVGGCTFGKGQIFISIDTNHPNWKAMLSYTLAHEYHHSVLLGMPMKWHLLDRIILEGKADVFAKKLYPEVLVPWLLEEDQTLPWEAFYENLYAIDDAFNQKMIFGDGLQYPWWCGYKMGFLVVQKYVQNHPKMATEKWTKQSALKILKQCGYDS